MKLVSFLRSKLPKEDDTLANDTCLWAAAMLLRALICHRRWTPSFSSTDMASTEVQTRLSCTFEGASSVSVNAVDSGSQPILKERLGQWLLSRLYSLHNVLWKLYATLQSHSLDHGVEYLNRRVYMDDLTHSVSDDGSKGLNQMQSAAGNEGSHMDCTSNGTNPPEEKAFGGVEGHLKRLCKNGRLNEAISFWNRLDQHGIQASQYTCIFLLQECIHARALVEGEQVHAYLLKNGHILDIFVGNMLVNLYAKCDRAADAQCMFKKMPERNVFSWSLLIGGYIQVGNHEEAHVLFWRMESEGVKPNTVTFLSILKACGTLEQGKRVHTYIIQSGLDSNNFLRSTLIDMYAKCGNLEFARQVFEETFERDVVTWNSMIAGYAQRGHGNEALGLFLQMQQEGLEADQVTFSSILKACSSLEALKQGKQIHCHIMRSRTNLATVVQNALIDMYSKCGSFECSCDVFFKMVKRDVISWTSMIAGYAQHGFSQEAFRLFWEMQKESVRPDEIAYISVLKACANLAALELGKQIHDHIIAHRSKLRVLLGNTLVDMYAKCGSMEHARQVFQNMPQKDLISWSAMVSGYALHGSAMEALQLVEQMYFKGMKLDHITYIGVLSACSHAGLVDEGCRYFDSMCQNHGIFPTSEHYACMVDLLARAGRLAEAMEFIDEIPFEPGVEIWTAVLAACRNYGEVKLAEHAAKCILKLKPHNTAAFVLLSNIYAEAGRWEERARVRKLMEARGVDKEH